MRITHTHTLAHTYLLVNTPRLLQKSIIFMQVQTIRYARAAVTQIYIIRHIKGSVNIDIFMCTLAFVRVFVFAFLFIQKSLVRVFEP